MEIRLNIAILTALAVAWLALKTGEPVAGLDPALAETADLAALEDGFARNPNDVLTLRRLTDRYLELNRPELAVSALRAADPEYLQDPQLTHRLAKAYEASGRLTDAQLTAALAMARCARALGTADGPSTSELPTYGCRAREYAILQMHHAALTHMVHWGVTDPTVDSRSRRAYDLAMRRASVASLE